MSVIAAAAVGTAPVVVPYGLYGGGTTRKGKDVVRPEEAAAEERQDGGEDSDGVHGLSVPDTGVEEDREAEAEGEWPSIDTVSHNKAMEDGEEVESSPRRKKKGAGEFPCLDALPIIMPMNELSDFILGEH